WRVGKSLLLPFSRILPKSVVRGGNIRLTLPLALHDLGDLIAVDLFLITLLIGIPEFDYKRSRGEWGSLFCCPSAGFCRRASFEGEISG
ncbi:hypothetical protein G032_20885, partial [Pectobacterium carotovorum subsp. carotovorum ICMP 5702]